RRHTRFSRDWSSDVCSSDLERIQPHIHRTPVLTSSRLNDVSGASLFFKCENFQKGGAFKARGATNAVFSLDDTAARRGVATHSRSEERRVGKECRLRWSAEC